MCKQRAGIATGAIRNKPLPGRKAADKLLCTYFAELINTVDTQADSAIHATRLKLISRVLTGSSTPNAGPEGSSHAAIAALLADMQFRSSNAPTGSDEPAPASGTAGAQLHAQQHVPSLSALPELSRPYLFTAHFPPLEGSATPCTVATPLHVLAAVLHSCSRPQHEMLVDGHRRC